MSINNLFNNVRSVKFEDCNEAYIVNTKKCEATIGVTDDEVVMSFICSFSKGGGSEMLDKLESYAKSLNKTFIVSNIINPKLISMVKERGYIKDMVPFCPKEGLMDLVEIYKKTN